MRAIFLDKDGTLVENVPHNVDANRVVLCPKAIEGLRLFQQDRYALFIVSNQPGIALGYFGEEDLLRLQRYLTQLLVERGIALRGFYFCPHSPDGSVAPYATLCTCRKPMPGLLLRAAREHGIDLAHSWMIGDILHDVEAGRRAGCKTVLIDNGNETEWQRGTLRTPHVIANNLRAAAKAIAIMDAVPK